MTTFTKQWRKRAALAVTSTALLTILSSTSASAERPSATRGSIYPYQAAGTVGGGVLQPGTTYAPERKRPVAVLVRTDTRIRFHVVTDGLPPGAYSVWWVVFNEPSACTGPCDEPDLFDPATQSSVFYATGGVVAEDGVGVFRDRHGVNDWRGAPGVQDILHGGGIDPHEAFILNVIKYHGPASSDPAVLEAQTTTISGSCDDGANAVDLGPPFGVQCFDPQIVVYPMP